jgi:hypothetical protein
MAQSDQVVQNATFPTVRADINDNLAALYSQSSGNTAPTVTVAFQPWIDTSSNPPVKKVRNSSNTAWITEGVLDPAGFQVGGITQIANGGTGATTATAALAALLPSQGGNAGKALVTDGSAATWIANGITRGTAVASTSGTSIDFISIPAGVKRVTVMFNGVSTNGTSNLQIQVGAGSVTTSGYSSVSSATGGGIEITPTAVVTSGMVIRNETGAGGVLSGIIHLTNITGNTWVSSHTFCDTGTTRVGMGGGNIALSGTLDRLRITTVNGTDTFDNGSINILYES